jgi:hypothetical protein
MENSNEQIEEKFKDVIKNILKGCNIEDFIRTKYIFETPYILPELQTIKHQICHCIIMGFYIAAITLTNHLFEKFLKFTLIYNDIKKNKSDTDKEFSLVDDITLSMRKYDKRNLSVNIHSSYKEGLISDKQKEILIKLKDLYRNSFSHCDREKMYGNLETGLTEVKGEENALKFIDGNENDLPQRNEKIFNLLFADFIFIHEFSRVNSIPYLIELDKIIREVEKKLFPGKNEI